MNDKSTRGQEQQTPTHRYAITLAGLLVMFLCWNVRGSGSKSTTAEPSGAKPGSVTIPELSPCSPIPTIAAGQWRIAGADWNFAVRTATESEIEDVLREPPGGWSAVGTSEPQHLAVFELFKSRLTKLEGAPGMDVHGSVSPTLKMRLFSRPDRPAALGGYVAYPRGKAWTVLGITPARGPATTPVQRALLPLPATIRHICTRVGDDGRSQCEVVATSDSASQLTRFWQAHDWKVHRPRWTREHGNILFCERHDRFVQVTMQRVPGQNQRLLILVAAELAESPAS